MEMAEPATSEEDDYMSMIIGEPEKKPIRGSYVEQVKQKQREVSPS